MADISESHRLDPFLDQRWQAVSNTDGSFYVRAEDELRLSVFTSVAGLTITLNGVYLTLHGDPVPFQMVLNPTGSGVRESVVQKIGPAFVLYAYPTLSGGTPAVGTVDLAVEILQSTSGTGPIVKQLMFGTLTARGYIKYVDVLNTVTVTGTVTATPSAPTVVTTALSAPAAGAELVATVTAGQIWSIQGFAYQFATSAAVATRESMLFTDDGTNTFLFGSSHLSQVANTTQNIAWGNFGVNVVPAVSSFNGIPFPPVTLAGGYRIRTQTQNLQPTDQYSQGVISYLRLA
jgi:hypothetical protein